MSSIRLQREFYTDDVLIVAKKLIGKLLCRRYEDGSVKKYRINETEAYKAPDDLACHAAKGRTERTEAFYMSGGHVYVYLCYGIHWLINIVTGKEDDPQAVLIRGIETAPGPGRVGSRLELSKKLYGTDLTTSDIIWLEDDGTEWDYIETPRVGIDYAGEPWISKPWRFYHETEESRKVAPKIGTKPTKKKSSKKKIEKKAHMVDLSSDSNDSSY